jgi:pseudouridine-5'-phosphate glycosidase
MSVNRPPVALESTVISHGLPYPQNLSLAREMENIVRSYGAEPRTVAILGGELRAGLSDEELHHLATASNVRKVSRRDLPIAVARWSWKRSMMPIGVKSTLSRMKRSNASGGIEPLQCVLTWSEIGSGIPMA